MKVKLMNSAMMPTPGTYTMRKLTSAQFMEAVQAAHADGILESYIGYPQNVELIESMTGVRVELNRAMTTVEDGDDMLVMKLKYRPDAATKGQLVDADAFEFYHVTYRR